MPYKDPEKQRVYMADWATEHREERRVYAATRRSQFCAEQIEARRAYMANYYAAHQEEWQVANAKWDREHREERRALTTNHYHRRRANGGNFSRAAWEHLKALFGRCCAYCGRRMERLTQDHIIPLSKGGWHCSMNIVPACQSCNSRKGATL